MLHPARYPDEQEILFVALALGSTPSPVRRRRGLIHFSLVAWLPPAPGALKYYKRMGDEEMTRQAWRPMGRLVGDNRQYHRVRADPTGLGVLSFRPRPELGEGVGGEIWFPCGSRFVGQAKASRGPRFHRRCRARMPDLRGGASRP